MDEYTLLGLASLLFFYVRPFIYGTAVLAGLVTMICKPRTTKILGLSFALSSASLVLECVAQIVLKTEGDHWYDVWCAYRYTTPLSWMKNYPILGLLDNVEDPEALKKLPDHYCHIGSDFVIICSGLRRIHRRRCHIIYLRCGHIPYRHQGIL